LADAKAAGWSEWIKSEADERAMLNGCYFDQQPNPDYDPTQPEDRNANPRYNGAGFKVCRFFEQYLVHSMEPWRGRPFELMDCQRNDILIPLFGWKRKDGTRRYRRFNCWVAKKNFKSTMCGGLANYFILGDGEPRAQVYGAAFTREQTKQVFDEAAAFVTTSPELKARLEVVLSQHRIVCHATQSFYKSLAGEAGAVEGLNAHGIIFDELHVQRNRKLWDSLRFAGAARRQPMLANISTVGVRDEKAIWWEEWQYTKDALAGVFYDDEFLGYIAAADEHCDPGDREQWKKANPGLGVTVRWEEMQGVYNEALNSPPKMNIFKRYRLNIPQAQEEAAINMAHWDACGGEIPDLAGRRCFGGLDLADSEDLTAFALYFPSEGDEDEEDDESDYLLVHFWLPIEQVWERTKEGRTYYEQWYNAGLLDTTGGKTLSDDAVVETIIKYGEQYDIVEMGADPWNAKHVINRLNQIKEDWCIKVPQKMYAMALGTKGLLSAIIDGGVRHGNHPILTWNAQNMSVECDHEGNMRPSKKHSPQKIDGMVAACIAKGRAMVAVVTDDSSVYEERGLTIL
jgi:phage terminase large subunit-like protein